MSLEFRPLIDSEIPLSKQYAMSLYAEDAGGKLMNGEKIGKTVQYLRSNPQNGVVLSILKDEQCVGYAILINFWSNEYGGIVLHIDELYVAEAFRNQQIASRFIAFLKDRKFNNCKALFLEVNPDNHGATKLYSKLGFEYLENKKMKINI